jgi:hypothetical protein
MKAETLRQRLIAAGRHYRPADTVPFAFEKRILARIAQAKTDPWLLWNQILWRCAAPCVALTILTGALAYYAQQDSQASESLVTDLETAIYAPISTSTEVW